MLKKHTLEPFLSVLVSMTSCRSDGRLPGSWTRIAETKFSKFNYCSWQNIVCSISIPQPFVGFLCVQQNSLVIFLFYVPKSSKSVKRFTVGKIMLKIT